MSTNLPEEPVKKKRKISHAGARQKGLSFEREVAIALRHIFPEAERHLEFQVSSAKGFDLKGTDPLKIQCKRNAGYASISKIEEVHPVVGDIPVLITKGDHKKAVAVLYLEDFIMFLEKMYGRVCRDISLPPVALTSFGLRSSEVEDLI